jgi:hypothetical protein
MTDLHQAFVLKASINDKLVFVLVLKYKSSLFVGHINVAGHLGAKKQVIREAIVTAS